MNVLLLVHPDCLSSDYFFTAKQAEKYLGKLEEHLPKFDKLIVFRMHGPVGTKHLEEADEVRRDHFKRLNVLLSKADLDLYDFDLGSSLFNNEISSFIIDNPGGTLYLAGGYQSGCLRQVAHHLAYNIGWLVKEQNYKVRIFEPLVFRFEQGSGPEGRRADHPWWDKRWPGKIGDWGYEQEDENVKRIERLEIPKDYRHSGGLNAAPGEYKRDSWWEGPVDKISGIERLRKVLAEVQYFSNEKARWNIDVMMDYAVKNLKLQQIPLELLLENGQLPGSSDEPDDSPDFFARVKGLGLPQYESGQYPPVLIVHEKQSDGEYWVADGRHRIVNYLDLLKKNSQSYKGKTIKGYIIDLDDPSVEIEHKNINAQSSSNWIKNNVSDPVSHCFFYSAVMALLFDGKLFKGPPGDRYPGETAHFWVEINGRLSDPTIEQYQGYGGYNKYNQGIEASAINNIDAVIDDPLFKTLPKLEQEMILKKKEA